MGFSLCLQIKIFKASSAEFNDLELQDVSTTCAAVHNSLKVMADARGKKFNETARSVAQDSCSQREPEVDADLKYSWIWGYLEEYIPGSRVSKIENSLDERMSNQLYATSMATTLGYDVLTVNTGDKQLDQHIQKLAAGNYINEHKCEQHLRTMVSKLRELEQIVERKRYGAKNDTLSLDESHIRLANVLDTFGHYDSGILSGRNVILGSYTRCLKSDLILDDKNPDVRTNTRYCQAKLKIDNHLDVELKERKMKHHETEHALSIGICIPNSCHSISFTPKTKHLFQTLVDSQFRMPSSLYIDELLEVKSIHCEVDESSELRSLSWFGKILIVLLICWMSLVIYATRRKFLDQSRIGNEETFKSEKTSNHREDSLTHHERTTIQCIYDSINVQNSWSTFIKPYDINERVNLNTLSLIKVLSCFFVVLGHVYLVILASNTTSLLSLISDSDTDPSKMLMISLTMIVDTFFVLSGMLIGFSAMRKFSGSQNNNKPVRSTSESLSLYGKQWFGLSISRYLRLVPLYFLVFCFKKSLFIHLGSGPLWDLGLNKELYMGRCLRATSWFVPFSLATNYTKLKQLCVGQAWSVSNDIFFAITLTPIVVLMTKKPIQATILSIVICLASSYSMYLDFTNIPASISNLMREGRTVGFLLLGQFSDAWYIAPHNRLSPVLVGVFFGYLMHKYNESKERKQWPSWLRGAATKCSIAVIISSFLILPVFAIYRYSFFKYYPIHRNLLGHSVTSGRLIFALANSIIFLRMTTDWKDNHLMRFCSSDIWRIVAKLNYPLLLVHLDIITFKYLTRTSSTDFSFTEIIYDTGSVYSIGCLLALFIHILIEIPINRLINIFILGKLFGKNEVKKVLNGKHKG